MRILSIGNFGHGWDGSICDELHISNALKELGHNIVNIDRDNPNLKYGGTLEDNDPDFILIAQYDRYPEDMIPNLKKTWDCPVVYWAFDYQADGQEWHEKLIKQADLYLSKRLADSKYPNWRWLPQDFAPSFLRKLPDDFGPDIDVLFTGSYLPWATERNEILKAVDEKYNLVIHSVNAWPGFKDVREPLMDRSLPILYNRAKVILSIDHTIEAGYWSDRNAQIMACGGLVLFKYVPMSNFVFRDGVIYFNTVEECLDTIDKILNKADPEMLDAVRLRGNQLAQRNLMVQHRVADLLIIMESIL